MFVGRLGCDGTGQLAWDAFEHRLGPSPAQRKQTRWNSPPGAPGAAGLVAVWKGVVSQSAGRCLTELLCGPELCVPASASLGCVCSQAVVCVHPRGKARSPG